MQHNRMRSKSSHVPMQSSNRAASALQAACKACLCLPSGKKPAMQQSYMVFKRSHVCMQSAEQACSAEVRQRQCCRQHAKTAGACFYAASLKCRIAVRCAKSDMCSSSQQNRLAQLRSGNGSMQRLLVPAGLQKDSNAA